MSNFWQSVVASKKRRLLLVWGYFGLIAILNGLGVVLYEQGQPAEITLHLLDFIFPATLIVFAFVGALIVSRQPHNQIGLLLLLPGTSFASFMDGVVEMFSNGLWAVPNPPTPLFLLLIWFASWNWVLLIFPLLYLLVLFPTGRLQSPHWRWLLYYITAVMLVIPILGTFGQQLAPASKEDWGFANPIGFIDPDWVNISFLPFFFVAVPLCVVLCVVSLFIRFRRAQGVERAQMKWLFLAGGIFAATYVPPFIRGSFTENTILNSAWVLGMMTIPLSIGVAILRHRLFDIDVIIRKTVQYGMVTAVLALVYFGTIILLQTIIGQATGEQSPIIIVLSTLLIAALFNPLRQRVQTFIDRRFYRQKYDAQQVLADFAQTARDEVEMEALQAELLRVVQETMQPKEVGIWFKPMNRKIDNKA